MPTRTAAPVGPPIRSRTCRLFLIAALLSPGCATLNYRGQESAPLVPTKYQTATGPYKVFTSGPVSADDPALRNLQALSQQLEAALDVRVPEGQPPVEVYVLDDEPTFSHFLRYYYPELPPRRAFFLAQGPRRVVYTYRNPRLVEDLRHEATHALLHAAVADLPLWLDEGLAEYFEVAGEPAGLNAEHVARLPADIADGWEPDLKRLESLQDVRQMSPRDYRESWAWVHFLLADPDARSTLKAYLSDLHAGRADAPALSRRLDAAGAARLAMIEHVEGLRHGRQTATVLVPSTTVRLQDAPALKALKSKRPGLVRRVLGLFGFGDSEGKPRQRGPMP